MKETLALRFSVHFRGTLWNTVALAAQNLLFLELRDELKRRVTFSALRYDQGVFTWQEREIAEKWWIGLLAASGNTLLLQRFNPETPESRGLVAVNAATGDTLWMRDEFVVDTVGNGWVLGYSGSGRERLTLDLESGRDVDKKTDTEYTEDKISVPIRPFRYEAGTPYYNTVQKFLTTRFDHSPEGSVEYLEFEGKVVISYHIRMPDGLANHLLVLRESGAVMLHIRIAEKLKGLGTDTFFVLAGCLFFVRNGDEFLSYQLS
ncbi:MAG TPA: DUF4905 domain-containing protein [Cyclobacteriaceae bacterium]